MNSHILGTMIKEVTTVSSSCPRTAKVSGKVSKGKTTYAKQMIPAIAGKIFLYAGTLGSRNSLQKSFAKFGI